MEALKNENYVDLAENVIKKMKKEKDENPRKKLVTTTKIRNLLSMISDIYNEILDKPEEKLGRDIQDRISYLRVRFAYEAGREPVVREFVDAACILDHIKNIKGSRAEFILFSRYMEALVAFFKYYGLDEKER